jgi:hypothetical protein
MFYRHKNCKEQPSVKIQGNHIWNYIFLLCFALECALLASWIFEKNSTGQSYLMNKRVKSLKKVNCCSNNMAGQVLCYDPVTIETVEPFWQDCKFTHDRFIGVGNAPGIRATDESDNK